MGEALMDKSPWRIMLPCSLTAFSLLIGAQAQPKKTPTTAQTLNDREWAEWLAAENNYRKAIQLKGSNSAEALLARKRLDDLVESYGRELPASDRINDLKPPITRR